MPAAPESNISLTPKPDTHSFALFALGFRPFYLAASILAAVSLPLWVAQYFGLLPQAGFISGLAWHTHEMVFGFAAAVISGFLLTAVRNWTGLPTPSGGTLASITALWLAGRVVMVTGPGPLAAAIDVAFLPVVCWYLWQPLHRARSRNQFMVGILLALAAVNLVFHLANSGVLALAPVAWAQGGLALVVIVVAIMSGRVIPAFTRNAIPTARVRQIKGLDPVAIGTLLAALLSWLAAMPEWVVVPLAAAAAVVNAARLWSWDPWCTRAQPILWILHLSYAWIPVGMLLLALAVAGIAGSVALALHAFSVGAIGGMIIGMITRTARGHTGRPLKASKTEVLAYALVPLAAAFRVFLPLVWPPYYAAAVAISAVFWSGAFALYTIQYWPILTRARIDGKPG